MFYYTVQKIVMVYIQDICVNVVENFSTPENGIYKGSKVLSYNV